MLIGIKRRDKTAYLGLALPDIDKGRNGFCCSLFENINTPNASKFCSSDGFNTWWKLNPKVLNHQSSAMHNQIYCKWKELECRLQKGQTTDKKEQNIVTKETKIMAKNSFQNV